ncbi:hypothetical protein KBC89_03785 [Candidatus Woesebacteria bacterium]|nr:hypothetical protein [Candidatus Woesebacteria bacterium]
MKSLVTLFSLVLLAPLASLSTDSARRYVYLTFANTKGVTKIDYTLTYNSGTRQKGFAGGFKNNSTTSRSVRKQILGTCSSGRCVYHAGVKNIQLSTTFVLKNGQRITQTKTLN